MVDDQPINVKLLQRKLERQGMEVLVAYNGKECIQIVNGAHPNLILLDVMMPEMDGIETCQKLKANPLTAAIPIIFITAKTSREGKVEGLDAGAVDYITKPIDLDETLARVRTQLRLQEMHKENVFLQERLGDARKTAAIGAITKGIAHNLNNLLGVMVGYLDLIKNGYDSPDLVKRSIKMMDNSTSRMVEIVSQLGAIANEENIQMFNLQVLPLLDNSISRFKAQNSISEDIVVPNFSFDQKEKIRANGEIFENMLMVLIQNAWESYPNSTPKAERKILINAEITQNENEPFLVVEVIDNGAGIPKEVADVLFEPFTTSKTSIGRGMGLAVARNTLRHLGGDVTAVPHKDGGVIAKLTHPL